MGAGKPGRGRRSLGGRQAPWLVGAELGEPGCGRGQWGLAAFFLFPPEAAPVLRSRLLSCLGWSAPVCARVSESACVPCECVRSGVSAASLGSSAVHKLRPEDVKALGDS